MRKKYEKGKLDSLFLISLFLVILSKSSALNILNILDTIYFVLLSLDLGEKERKMLRTETK